MTTCPGCGGVVGRDCWNPSECEWISRDMAMRAAMPQQPEPCQGCSEITGGMTECLGCCKGARSWDDIEARAAVWATLVSTYADPQPTRPSDERTADE